jgi:hypothetical protein
MEIGSARKIFDTKPPKVAIDQTAKKSTKKLIPSTTRVLGATGVSGLMDKLKTALLNEASISQFCEIWNLFDDASLKQQICRFFAECSMFTREEFLIRRFILPT